MTEASGAVTASAPLTAPHAIVRGEVFAPGTTITTGSDGRLVFGDGKTVVTMAASSRLTTPSDSSDVMTRFTEDMGSVFFRVEKRPMQHFEVQGPLLAAVVKGTQFTVSIDGDKNSISVSEGLVEAVAMQGGARQFVPAGRAAAVDRAQPHKLELSQAGASGTGSINRAIGAEPINYATVTDGLVRSEPITPAYSTGSHTVAIAETTPAASEDGASNGNGGGGGGGNGNGGGNDGANGDNGGGNGGDTGNTGDTGNGGGNGDGNNGNGNGNGGGDGSNGGGNGNGNNGNGNGNGGGDGSNGGGNGGGDGSNGGGNGNGNNGNGNGNGGGDGSNGGGNGNGNNGNGNGNGGGNGGGLPGGGDAPGNGNGNGNGNGGGHGRGHGKGG